PGGGVPAHGVEVLQQGQIGGHEVIEDLPGGDQRPLYVVPRQAGRVLALDCVGHFCTRAHAVMIGGIVMRALTANASWRNRGTNASMSASSSMANPCCSAIGNTNRHTSAAYARRSVSAAVPMGVSRVSCGAPRP